MSVDERGGKPVLGEAVDKASTALGAGLAIFTASLGAIGGLSGGIARTFRNGSYGWIAAAFVLVLGSVVLAVAARLMPSRFWAVSVLVVSMSCFGSGTFIAISQMVESAKTEDRPALTAQLVAVDSGGWVLKVQASTGGLSAEDQLLVLVYGQPKRIPSPAPPLPTTRPGVTPPETAGRPSPSPTAIVAGRLDGDRLFFAQAGPNSDGVASQNVEIPILVEHGYQTIVVTANLGAFPRNCEGTPVNVQDNTDLLVPPEAQGRRSTTLSCLALAAPDQPRPMPTPTPSPAR